MLIRIMLLLSSLWICGPALGKCTIDITDTKLEWMGYKFSAKTGVKGSFDIINWQYNRASATLAGAINSIKFEIDTASISSGDNQRDKKLALYVFGPITNSGVISGETKSFTKSKATASITMNGKTNVIPFVVKQTDKVVEFTGKIDILNFGMKQSHEGISKACSLLHTGKDGKPKTWSEVGLKVTAGYTKKCS